MIFLGFVALAIIFVAGYLLNGWATSHALAVLEADKWVIQAEGWTGLWPLLTVGLLTGVAVGLAVGLVMSGKIAQAIASGKDTALDAARADLAKREQTLTQHIIHSTKEASDKALKYAAETNQAEEKLLHAQRKQRIIEGRLKGAQQKAARLKKTQARLTSV